MSTAMELPIEAVSADSQANPFRLMIASRQRSELNSLYDLAKDIAGVEIYQNYISNCHSDPLYGVQTLPHLLMFWLSDVWEAELSEMIARPLSQRVPIIFLGNIDDSRLLRMALKAGGMDYFRAPFDESEIRQVIEAVIDKRRDAMQVHQGKLTAVISAKGGAGGSFIACNIAHVTHEVFRQKVALLGLDIQFGSLCGYLDMESRYGLSDVLSNIDDMDDAALRGFMAHHPSGLDLLDGRSSELLLPQDLDASRINPMLDLMLRSYDQVVVDMPRHIDLLTASFLERSHRVLIVLQQTVAHLHDAQRLVKLLHREMDISMERIALVVNRYDRRSELDEASIGKSVGRPVALTVPNAFEQVSGCINAGRLVYSEHRRAPVARAMLKMGETLAGGDRAHRRSGLHRLRRLFGGQ